MSAEIEILRQTAGLLAAGLGAGWSADTSNDYTWQVSLTGPDGERLYLRNAERGRSGDLRRFEVSGSLYDLIPAGKLNSVYLPPGCDGGSITVARERGIEALTREVERRLLPKLRLDMAIARERVAAMNAADAGQAVTAEKIGASKYNGCWYLSVRDIGGSGWISLDSISHDGSSVSLSMHSLPVDVAVSVLEMLRSV